jgi:crotonobetainyl-CoA:carnitine CoA-transferase CaiB-like acyl-CoA transferase
VATAYPLSAISVERFKSFRDDTVELLACREAQVPCGPLYSIAEIFGDPQYAHR